jgi:hypothetical protein
MGLPLGALSLSLLSLLLLLFKVKRRCKKYEEKILRRKFGFLCKRRTLIRKSTESPFFVLLQKIEQGCLMPKNEKSQIWPEVVSKRPNS